MIQSIISYQLKKINKLNLIYIDSNENKQVENDAEIETIEKIGKFTF